MSEGDSGASRIIGKIGLCVVLVGLSALGKAERAYRRATGSGRQEVVESPSQRQMREEYNRAVIAHNVACKHLEAGRYQKAVDGFTKAIAMRPNGSESLVHRGMAYCKLEMWQEALADFTRANPSPAASINELAAVRGDCLFALGRTREAETTYTEGLRNSPGDAQLLLRRARVRGELDDVDGALADFDALFQQDLGVAGRKLVEEAYYARARLRISRGDFVKGRADFDTASKMGSGRHTRVAGGDPTNDISADAQESDVSMTVSQEKE